MSKYEIRDVVSDYGIYKDGELLLILNSRTNAEYIKAILEHEERHPNAGVPYSPEVAGMSDEECLAVFRLCASNANKCEKCPLRNLDDCFIQIDRRVLAMAERALEPSSARCDCKKQRKEVASEDDEKKQIEAMAKDVSRSIVWCDEVVPAVNCLGTAAVLYGKNYRKQSEWISVEERLPEPFVSVLVYMPGETPHPTVREGFVNKRGEWYAGGYDRLPDEVVSWRKMPKPPMMKGGEQQ